MLALKVGRTEMREIAARAWQVATGILIEAAGTYELRASDTWKDWTIVSGPEGYSSRNVVQRLSGRWRRVPSAPWFALIGVIGSGAPFKIGATDVAPGHAGELVCFANDLRLFYFNNSGAVTLTIRRVG
jgi:hypothetical protein